MREYTTNGKTLKYFALLNDFKAKAKAAVEKYKDKLTLTCFKEDEEVYILPSKS